MNYTVSDERVDLLAEKFVAFSFEKRKPGEEFFHTLTNPVELPIIAGIFNWDDETEVLSGIIDSSICNMATAAMIFWHAQPGYYTEFDNEQELMWGADVYRLLRNITAN